MNRRRWTLSAIAASLLSGAGALVVRAWLPWITRAPDGRWRLGPRSRFAPGSVTLLRRARAVVVNDALGIHVLSADCTHQSCLVHDVPARHELSCPCHGSAFDYSGRVLRGLATRDLPWLEVREERGELLLDPSRQVDKEEG